MAQSADGPHNSPPDANASGSPPEARKPRQSVLEQSINILRSEWRDSGSKERGIDRFRQFDTNGDGMVDFNEFVVGCRSSALSSTQLKDLFDALDGDGNQQLDYREFLDLLNGKKALAHEARRSSLQLLQLEGQKVPTAEGAEFMSVCVDILENAKARRDTNEELHAPLAPRVLQTDSQRDRTFLTNCRHLEFSTTKRRETAHQETRTSWASLPSLYTSRYNKKQPRAYHASQYLPSDVAPSPRPPPPPLSEAIKPVWRWNKHPMIPALNIPETKKSTRQGCQTHRPHTLDQKRMRAAVKHPVSARLPLDYSRFVSRVLRPIEEASEPLTEPLPAVRAVASMIQETKAFLSRDVDVNQPVAVITADASVEQEW